MNLCFVNTTDLIGGAERCSFDLMRGLRDRGHDVSLVVGRKLSDDPAVLPCRYSEWDWRLRAMLYNRLGITDTTLVSPLMLCRRHPAFLNADVVNLHNMHGAYWNLWTLPLLSRSRPVVLTMHDEWMLTGDCAYSYDCNRWLATCGRCPQMRQEFRPVLGGRDATRVNLVLKHWAARACHTRNVTFVTPSEWLATRVRRSPHLSSFDTRVIPNGVDLAVYAPHDKTAARAELDLPQDQFCFLFFALNVNDPRKGFPLLEAALRERGLPERSCLVVLGQGFESAASRWPGVPVLFKGHQQDRRQVAKYLAAADCMILLSGADNLPYTAIEAAACGTPVLARAIGGIPEIVLDGETGFLTTPDPAPAEVAAALKRVCELPSSLLSQLGRNARRHAEASFDLHRFLANYERLFAEAAERAAGTPPHQQAGQ